MDAYSAENILSLANLGLQPLNGVSLLNFFTDFGIGRTRLGFCGIRLQNSDGKAEHPWVCLSLNDVTEAKQAWNPPLDSPEIMEAANTDEERYELERLNNAKFQYILDEPWQTKVCTKMVEESANGRLFLKGFISSDNQNCEGVNISRNFIEPPILMSFMEEKLKKLNQASDYFKLDPTQQPTKIAFNPYATFSCLEDELAVKFYLAPYLKGATEIWKRSRICAECGKFFFYKQERARYCSQKCRMAVANRERRQK